MIDDIIKHEVTNEKTACLFLYFADCFGTCFCRRRKGENWGCDYRLPLSGYYKRCSAESKIHQMERSPFGSD